MQPFLGRRYGVEDLYESEKSHRPDLKLMRAFEVTPLINTTFTISHEKEVPTAVKTLLESKLPGIEWNVDVHWYGPLRKYFFIHHSIPAPPDPLTKQPMALELYGPVIAIEGKSVSRKDIGKLMADRPEDYFSKELEGNITIRIEAATYANVTHPGAGVPLYL